MPYNRNCFLLAGGPGVGDDVLRLCKHHSSRATLCAYRRRLQGKSVCRYFFFFFSTKQHHRYRSGLFRFSSRSNKFNHFQTGRWSSVCLTDEVTKRFYTIMIVFVYLFTIVFITKLIYLPYSRIGSEQNDLLLCTVGVRFRRAVFLI